MVNNKGVYVPSVDAKDIYLSSHYLEKDSCEYDLKLKDGQYNLRKFSNTLDYSLDLIELRKIYYKKYRKNDFSFKIKKHEYTKNVINITFKYSVKKWNQMNKNTFVKFGYDYRDLMFEDGIARNSNKEIVGIKLNEKIENPVDLPEIFGSVEVKIYDKKDKTQIKETQFQYVKLREPKTVMTNAQLRTYLYKHGFVCNGVKYCRMKRSTGSARVGKCLFINEDLYEPILKFSSGGLKYNLGDPIDLAAYEGYIALPSSSIIDTIPIKPENILLIDDYESIFEEDVVETHDENNWLKTSEGKHEISNSIWDGQSLMDISLFGDYSEYGMLLLRNLMFKSCCFNCNIQQWFKDNGITEISQLNGKTRAEKIEDVKLITTPNSIKYLKFGSLDDWLDNLYPNFGVVKHDKKTHFFGGCLVQTHYQLLNTLQMSKNEVKEFLTESLDFAQMLRDRPEVVRYFIKYPDIDEFNPLERKMTAKSDVVYNLMCINENFLDTKYYRDFLIDLLRSYYKNLKNGHVYVNGNYSTLLGNPIEMLQQSIGKFTGESQIGIGNIHSTRFEYNKVLLASRSPHVTIGNIWLPFNTENKQIDKYMNLTNEIICLNSIGENVLQRLSGADFDSDTVMLTDNKYLINAAQKNYHIFKTPTAAVSSNKVKRYYTPEQKADLDIRTSVNKIGEIVNLSQELNSLLWDRLNHKKTYNDIKDLYYDICQLDVMSGLEIDKAKKEFDINNSKELDRLREKYAPFLTEKTEDGKKNGKKRVPHFFSHISKQKGYYNPEKKHYVKYDTTMDYLQTVVNSFKIKNSYKAKNLPFNTILDSHLYRTSSINYSQVEKVYSLIKKYINDRKVIFSSESDTKEEKAEKVEKLKSDLIVEINSELIGFSTLYYLLQSIENPENSQIKNLLLEILFLCGNDSFKKAIIQSRSTVSQLEDLDEDSTLEDIKDSSGSSTEKQKKTIKLFGIDYKITKKQVISEIESLSDIGVRDQI